VLGQSITQVGILFSFSSLFLSLLAGRWSFYSLSLLFLVPPTRLFLDPLEHSREKS
jgi:hypothetical protein